MVNHIRTALLNSVRPTDTAEEPWSRFMDPGFTPVALDSVASTARRALVGQFDDWWTLTYHVEALLALLHSSRYAQMLSTFDQRETALTQSPFSWTFKATVSPVTAEAADGNASILRPVSRPSKPVRVRRRWTVVIDSGNVVSVQEVGQPWAAESALENNRTIWAEDVGLSIDTPLVGAMWRVTVDVQPRNVIGDAINRVRGLSNDVTALLFTTENPANEERINTLKRWFSQSAFEDDKLAAVVFAYVLRFDALITQTTLL